MAGKWDLTEKDFETALLFHEKEKIEPVTTESLFRGALYSMLSSKDVYFNLIKAYNELLTAGLDTPDAINASGSRLTDIIKKAVYAKKKESYIRDFAEW
jgi:endonuclease III